MKLCWRNTDYLMTELLKGDLRDEEEIYMAAAQAACEWNGTNKVIEIRGYEFMVTCQDGTLENEECKP